MRIIVISALVLIAGCACKREHIQQAASSPVRGKKPAKLPPLKATQSPDGTWLVVCRTDAARVIGVGWTPEDARKQCEENWR